MRRFIRREDAPACLLERHGITITKQTLARMAVDGSGPVFQKNGRAVLYTEAALDEWAAARLSPPVRSTSELPKSPAQGRRVAVDPQQAEAAQAA